MSRELQPGDMVRMVGRELASRWKGKKATIIKRCQYNAWTVECEGVSLMLFDNEVSPVHNDKSTT